MVCPQTQTEGFQLKFEDLKNKFSIGILSTIVV